MAAPLSATGTALDPASCTVGGGGGVATLCECRVRDSANQARLGFSSHEMTQVPPLASALGGTSTGIMSIKPEEAQMNATRAIMMA